MRSGLGCIKTKVLQAFKTIYWCFCLVHGIYKQKEPVVAKNFCSFQGKSCPIIIRNKIRMKCLQLLNKASFGLAVTMHYNHFILVGYNELVFIFCLGIKTFITENWLKHQVFAFLMKK